MGFPNKIRRALTALVLVAIVSCVIMYVRCPAGAAYDICREVVSGSTAGRQSLVGSTWYAPLPLVLQLPLCCFLPPELASACYRFVLLLAFSAACFRFVLCKVRGTCSGSPAGCRVFDVASRVVIALAAFAFAAFSRNTVELTSNVFAAYSVLKLFSWSSARGTSDWVKLALALAATILCGLPFIGWATAVVLLLPGVIASDKETRPRMTGLMFLVCTPAAYVIICWMLASYLVIGDAFYAWRFVRGLEIAPSLHFMKVAGICCIPAIVAAFARKRGIVVASASVALSLAWFSALDSVGLGWARPYSDGRAALRAPDRIQIANYVNAATPWGRVFVCGYNGICHDYLNKLRADVLEPCIDLHIDVLRKAYSRQQLFVLVPKPQCENALESCNWRYGDIYANGAQRLLFAEDFGDWRLYEVISSEK